MKKDFDFLHSTIELIGETCNLKHSVKDPSSNHPAVDFIVQYLGKQKNEVESVADVELRIPICAECVEGLQDCNWLLIYCLSCNSSQWVYKPLARRPYSRHQHIAWMQDCPECVNFVDKGLN